MVTGDADGLVTHAGVVWLGEIADRSGLTAGLCRATSGLSRRRHHPGVTLTQMTIALADGATCVSDLVTFREQPALFGPMASHPTTWRSFERFGPVEFRGVAAARAQAREMAWAAGAGPDDDEAIIDFDSTLIRTRADKEDARPTYKGTFGHHPLLAMVAQTGEVLAGIIRPGNAGANCAADHVGLLDAAIAQLPAQWRAGHVQGADPATVQKRLVIRADAAGASHWFTEECREANIEFTIGYYIDHRVRDALLLAQEEDWVPAREPDGKRRRGAEVIELTELVSLDEWPDGTRLIVRREEPHPGAQLSLFDTVEGKRHTAFITDSTSDNIAALELRHRQRGRAEGIVRDVKACGLANLPFDGIANNDLWMQLCFTANDLLAWGRRISLDGPMRRATPKTIRYRLLHTAGRTSPQHHRLHLDRTWPWTPTLITAIDRIQCRLTAAQPTA
jgi:Transposase DDE domain group 1